MKRLHIDLETYSSVDIKKYGLHRYADAEDFEILLLAYAFDDEPVKVLDLFNGSGGGLEEIEWALTHPEVIKYAWNAAFEIACLTRLYGPVLDVSQWRDTAVHAAELGLPRSLAEASHVLKLPEDKAKMKEGKALINYFCKPCKATKVNGGRTRNLPKHDTKKWGVFKAYNAQDVEAEREIHHKLSVFPVPESEWRIWFLDQAINNRGALVDLDLVENAISIRDEMFSRLDAEARVLTGLDNPNSVAQLKDWLGENTDETIDTLNKADVAALSDATDDKIVSRVLKIRQEMGMTSVKKYDALRGAACRDGRIRGTLLFYGASRTGRWAGRVFQPQNLPQNHLSDLEGARWLLKHSDYETMKMVYDAPADVMSQLIRTAIIPKKDHKFIVADFSAVEARALAWMADEKWRLEVFKSHGKIYEASASAAFHVPIEEITKGSPLRQQGKVLELACGYGGSVGAIDAMDRDNAIPENERRSTVEAWRRASPNIVSFWWQMGDAAIQAVTNPGVKIPVGRKGVFFIKERGFLFMGLPSGRRLAYPNPRIRPGRYGDELTYDGTDQYTRRWGPIGTYGPKLVENLIQALCRDLLAHGMHKVTDAGYDIVLHVHDEAIVEVPRGTKVAEIETLLADLPVWAKGMPHRAEGFETFFYKKD